jgi:hypothetical protein
MRHLYSCSTCTHALLALMLYLYSCVCIRGVTYARCHKKQEVAKKLRLYLTEEWNKKNKDVKKEFNHHTIPVIEPKVFRVLVRACVR